MKRPAPNIVLKGCLLAGAAIILGSPAMAQDGSGIAGAWLIERPVTVLKTTDGSVPPLLPAALAVYRSHLADRAKGDTAFDPTTWCAAAGLPRLMTMNYPFEIVVRPRHVAFLHEWNWWGRVVYMDKVPTADMESPTPGPPPGGMPPSGGPPPQPPPPPFELGGALLPGPMGLSAGKWEGATLRIDTDNFIGSTLLDKAGLPHGDAMKLTEWFRVVAPDRLEERIRIDDPATYARPWETVLTFRRYQGEIREDVCLDRIRRGEPAVRD